MKKVKIQFEGKSYLRNIPQAYEELTLDQYCRLCSTFAGDENAGDYEVVSILFNLPLEDVNTLPAMQYQILTLYLGWFDRPLSEYIKEQKAGDKAILFDSEYDYPKEVGEIQIGQKLYLDGLIRNAANQEKYSHEVYADILAVMMMPSFLGKYDESYLTEFREMILGEPACNTIPLADFFLKRYNVLTIYGTLVLLGSELVKKLKRKLKSLISFLSLGRFSS